MIALARGSLATGSGNHHNPSSSTKHSSAWMSPSRLSSQQNNRSLGAVRQDGQPIAIPLSIDSVSSGLKIRIPRDLPNLPEAFRKRGAVRSQSSTTASTSTGSGTQPGIKRSHSTMVQEDHPESNDYVSYAVQGEGPRIKIVRRHPPAPGSIYVSPHLAGAKNLAIRTVRNPTSTSASTINNASTSLLSAPSSASAPILPPSVQKHRNHSKSKSNSPSSTPARIPSPAAGVSETTIVLPISSPAAESSRSAQTTAGSRSVDGVLQMATAGSGTPNNSASAAAKDEQNLSSSISSTILDSEFDALKPIELVRVGMAILGLLTSNTFCKSFINKVPTTLTNYHLTIKKPMDLTTIEHKLYKTLALAGAESGTFSNTLIKSAEWLSSGVTEGYATLQDFERDLRRISQNATYYNSPTHIIYKDAQEFQNLFTNLLTSYRQGKLILNIALPQEAYRPEIISISEPGPLYLFRAHTLREMERKMTDISTDLYASFHQPIFDICAEQIGQLSPEKPRFVRMYINKNRSILAKSRDERFARIAIISDLQVGKPYTVSNPTPDSPSNANSSISAKPGTGSNGAGNAGTSMVHMTAKILIGKPIGDRHDMVTVGDLDCPNAWITVACVRALEIDIEVPAKFDKILAKMRHEVVAYSSDAKIGLEHQRSFADALGLLLPSSAKGSSIGQRSSIPGTSPALSSTATAPQTIPLPSSNGLGLGISVAAPHPTPTPAPTITTRASALGGTLAQKNTANDQKTERFVKHKWVDLHDQGPDGQYLVKLRIPSLQKASHRPTPVSAVTSVTAAPPLHPIADSTPSTSLLPTRVNVLSSQVPATPFSGASERESLSAPDRIMLKEQITKRGYKMLQDLKATANEKNVPYVRWSAIEPTLTIDSAHGLFKRIYHVRGEEGLVVQNFKEMDAESFEQRVREVACLLKLRDLEGVGQIQSIIDDEDDRLVGLSMTKYEYTLKQYATNARRHPTPYQKLCLIQEMVSAMCAIHQAGLAHRDLSEVNIMVNEDPNNLLEDGSPRPHVKVIDFGKSVFVDRDEVQRWSMQEHIPEDELALLPFVVLPPDHGYKLYRSILTLPRTKNDHTPLPPVDPRSEDVYSLGVLIWRTFSGKSPWNGAIEDDLKTIRYLVSTDSQIKFQLEREITGPVSRELLLRCLTAQADTRYTTQQLKEWLDQPSVAAELLKEFEALGGGRKKLKKNLD